MRPTESSVGWGREGLVGGGRLGRWWGIQGFRGSGALTEVVWGVKSFHFGRALDAGRSGTVQCQVQFPGLDGGESQSLHQTETHAAGDGVLLPLRHLERPDDDPRENGKEEVNEDGRDCPDV